MNDQYGFDAVSVVPSEVASRFVAMRMLSNNDLGVDNAAKVSQIFSGVAFFMVAGWLTWANGTKLVFIQKASLETRLMTCCRLCTFVAMFSCFFNLFQLTEVDDIVLSRGDDFRMDLARPLEWIFTCPLMQLVLVLMGGSNLPENRRVIMPGLTLIILSFGTASLLNDTLWWRFGCYCIGVCFAMVMFYFNIQQIYENSNNREGVLKGDSEFRAATLLLVFLWFLFPLWFILSQEGLGIIEDLLIQNVGWAFLNITAKFSFIFHIQRIKDNYCSRQKVRQELYGVKGMNGGTEPSTENKHGNEEKSKLNAVVVETMSFLGMTQHAGRLLKLLSESGVTTISQVEELTKENCVDLCLPIDLVDALQKRISVWRLEMRDEAEDALEKGEFHYGELEKRRIDNAEDNAEIPSSIPFSLAGSQWGIASGGNWGGGKLGGEGLYAQKEPTTVAFGGFGAGAHGGGAQLARRSPTYVGSPVSPGGNGGNSAQMQNMEAKMEMLLRKVDEQAEQQNRQIDLFNRVLQKLDEQPVQASQPPRTDTDQFRQNNELSGVLKQLQQGMENLHDVMMRQETSLTRTQQSIENLHEVQLRQQIDLHGDVVKKIRETPSGGVASGGVDARQMRDMLDGFVAQVQQQQQPVARTRTKDGFESDDRMQDLSRQQISILDRIGKLQDHGDEKFTEIKEDLRKGLNKNASAMSGSAIDSIETTFHEVSMRHLSRMQQQIAEIVRSELRGSSTAAAPTTPGGAPPESRKTTWRSQQF